MRLQLLVRCVNPSQSSQHSAHSSAPRVPDNLWVRHSTRSGIPCQVRGGVSGGAIARILAVCYNEPADPGDASTRDCKGATMIGLTAALAEFIHVQTLGDFPP